MTSESSVPVDAQTRRRVGLVVLSGLAITAITVGVLATATAQRDRLAFEASAATVRDAVTDRVETSIALLRGTAGLFASQGAHVSVDAFRAYVDRLALREQYPGILGLGFSRRLEPAERAAFEARMRSEGHPGFHVWPAGQRAELHTIALLEPLDARNRAAIGYDMFTQDVRRAAMIRARDSGTASATGVVELVQEIDRQKQPGFLIYLPVYVGGAIPSRVDERRRRLLGFAYSPIRAGDFLSSAFVAEAQSQVSVAVYHGTESRRDALLYSKVLSGAPAHPRFTSRSTVYVAGEPWTFEFASTGTSGQALVLPALVAATGVALSVVLGMLLWRDAKARGAQARVSAENARLYAHEQALVGQLQEADRRKDEFLAILAHELRNPLAPIRQAAKISTLPNATPEQIRWSQAVVDRQVQHMALLLDDLLDVSRITRGKLELRTRRMAMKTAIDAAIETARPLIDARGHTLHVDLPAEPLCVDADPLRLAQVIGNLLSNAAKYTPPGGTLGIRARAESGTVVLEVSDSGLGIEGEALARVFDMFTQLHTTHGQGGLGIGLALVKGLVALHGGAVEARSEGAGRGSTFVVRLPHAPSPEAPAPEPERRHAADTARAHRILIADDNRDAAESLALYLTLGGHEVRTAYDGLEALHAAQSFEPDIALLDVGMPGLDGYELAQRLRAEPWGGDTLLVAITGWGQEEDKRRAREAGFDHHLTKPVDVETLSALVNDGLRKSAAPAG
jgi:signal transduction histidine kinase/ActR/RegA family two-component response regulator